MQKPMTEAQMTERLKDMKRAYVIIKTLETIACIGTTCGFIGILLIGSIDDRFTDDRAWPIILLAALICFVLLGIGAWFLNEIEGIPERLKKNIHILQRRIRKTRALARLEQERSSKAIIYPFRRVG